LCQNRFELYNRFGASQLTGYKNLLQGEISGFAVIPVDVKAVFGVSVTNGGNETVDLRSLFFLTSVTEYVFDDNVVAKSVLEPNQTDYYEIGIDDFDEEYRNFMENDELAAMLRVEAAVPSDEVPSNTSPTCFRARFEKIKFLDDEPPVSANLTNFSVSPIIP